MRDASRKGTEETTLQSDVQCHASREPTGVAKELAARSREAVAKSRALLERLWREKTIREIGADVASLRENAAKYRCLAEQLKGKSREKLMELVAELEVKANELEARSRD